MSYGIFLPQTLHVLHVVFMFPTGPYVTHAFAIVYMNAPLHVESAKWAGIMCESTDEQSAYVPIASELVF